MSTSNYEYQEPVMDNDEQMRVLIGMLLASHNYRTTLDPSDVLVAMPSGLGNGDLSGMLGLTLGLTLDILDRIGVDPEAFLLTLSNRLLEQGI